MDSRHVVDRQKELAESDETTHPPEQNPGEVFARHERKLHRNIGENYHRVPPFNVLGRVYMAPGNSRKSAPHSTAHQANLFHCLSLSLLRPGSWRGPRNRSDTLCDLALPDGKYTYMKNKLSNKVLDSETRRWHLLASLLLNLDLSEPPLMLDS